MPFSTTFPNLKKKSISVFVLYNKKEKYYTQKNVNRMNIVYIIKLLSLDLFVPPDPYHPTLIIISFSNHYSSTSMFNSSYCFHNFRKSNYDQTIFFLSSYD